GPLLRPVLRFVHPLRFLAHPLVALPVWAVDLYLWHLPFLYEAALHHPAIHALEHFLFFTCGGLMWAPVLETLPAPAWFGTGAKLGYIAIVRLIETVLGNVFLWSGHVFYPFYEHTRNLWGISALHDQGIAGTAPESHLQPSGRRAPAVSRQRRDRHLDRRAHARSDHRGDQRQHHERRLVRLLQVDDGRVPALPRDRQGEPGPRAVTRKLLR